MIVSVIMLTWAVLALEGTVTAIRVNVCSGLWSRCRQLYIQQSNADIIE